MKKIMAANWKMYKTGLEAASTIGELAELLRHKVPEGREVIVFAPATALAQTAQAVMAIAGAETGAQNMYPAEEGAFTGEISPGMIKACGASWVLAGHSERRHILGESDSFVGQKTAFALSQGLRVMLCVGETLEEREAGRLQEVLERQLCEALKSIRPDVAAEDIAVAYEPVWAIGTGRIAETADILEAHALCRTLLGKILGKKADEIHILYGGSVKPSNAGNVLALDNVDGVLVGGASLKADSFNQIINA